MASLNAPQINKWEDNYELSGSIIFEGGSNGLSVGPILVFARKDTIKKYKGQVSQLPQFPSPVFHLRVQWRRRTHKKIEQIRLISFIPD
jgi:hypothetical protein